ncbi:hypothetical protein DBR11_01990 [Pedobacter sp. HMWF019]|uniref:hypothetical protein n=1 Tax=Pedobacter sp. HMWF019 TaxID=2056856 RepID=UPI000D334A54|nr:hypothetical protein [Pedobacter sp. HMWF019]PTT03541.1 hypothetical protein DBR11_01990 [Pedobacter sp. HMWF019]
METKENIMEESLQEMKNVAAERTENYQQPQINGKKEQTVIIDPADTGETDQEEDEEDDESI